MIISLVVACGPKNEIGLDNKLLWHIPEDLKNFKAITTGKTIVMGRKTFESIGKALPNRKNVVITRDQSFSAQGVTVLSDPMMVFDLGLDDEEELGEQEIMVIGGGEIYQYFLPYTQKIYLSEIEYSGPADTFFPSFDIKEWEVVESKDFENFKYKVLNRL